MTLEIINDSALSPLAHGFFTRKGGASSGVFAGLNCGLGSSDQRELVMTNRARVAEAINVVPENLMTAHQIHSAKALIVEAPFDGPPPQADALVTATAGLALGALTADCAPILFADKEAGVVAAAHSGWKGAQGGIIEATIAAMQSLGAHPDHIEAVIGPCISQPHYEVGPEFFELFHDQDPAHSRFFTQGERDRMLFDLPGFVLSKLRASGVNAAWVGECTYADPERFYSFRRSTHKSEADYGRLISAIRL